MDFRLSEVNRFQLAFGISTVLCVWSLNSGTLGFLTTVVIAGVSSYLARSWYRRLTSPRTSLFRREPRWLLPVVGVVAPLLGRLGAFVAPFLWMVTPKVNTLNPPEVQLPPEFWW